MNERTHILQMSEIAQDSFNKLEMYRPSMNPTELENELNGLSTILMKSVVLKMKGEMSEDTYELIESGIFKQKALLTAINYDHLQLPNIYTILSNKSKDVYNRFENGIMHTWHDGKINETEINTKEKLSIAFMQLIREIDTNEGEFIRNTYANQLILMFVNKHENLK